MRIRFRQNNADGFTLIETLVAFVILALAAGAVLSALSSGPGRISRAANQRRATLFAQSLLAEAGTARNVEKGVWEGDLAAGGNWRVVVEPYDDSGANSNSTSQQLVRPYIVHAHVTAGSGWNAGTADLETVRLGPGAS